MGHLLLPYPLHAVSGIMHADWIATNCGTLPQVSCASQRHRREHSKTVGCLLALAIGLRTDAVITHARNRIMPTALVRLNESTP